MKIRELKREPYFTIEFDRSIPFTEDNESHEGIFTLKELEVLIDLARSVKVIPFVLFDLNQYLHLATYS